MQFREGMDVLDAGGEKAGGLERVVIDPRKGEVTHLVVRSGGLLGEEKVVPVDAVWYTDEAGVRLKLDTEALQALPVFEAINFLPLDESERGRLGYTGDILPGYWYPMAGMPPMTWTGEPWGAMPPFQVEQESNIPPGTIPLKEGAKVIDPQGKRIGDVEQVLTANEKNITHLVITKGGLLGGARKLIPAGWIDRLKEDAVQLSVSADFVERLKDYEA